MANHRVPVSRPSTVVLTVAVLAAMATVYAVVYAVLAVCVHLGWHA